MSGSRYFVRADAGAREKGPWTLDEIRRSFDDGLLKASALLREESGTQSRTVHEALGLAGAPPVTGKRGLDDRTLHARVRRQERSSRLGLGVVLLVGGLLLSMCSYTSASHSKTSGGEYFVFLALVVFGLVNIVRGVAGRRS